MKKPLPLTGLALLIAGMLMLSGCPDKTEDDGSINPALAGSWSNNKTGDELKTFTIKKNGNFTATLTPTGYDAEGTVTGILVKEGNDYMMNKMKETTGTNWGEAVGLYDRTYVQITLSNNDTVFELACADPIVEEFFGGTYYKED